jgi:hypothetical protein
MVQVHGYAVTVTARKPTFHFYSLPILLGAFEQKCTGGFLFLNLSFCSKRRGFLMLMKNLFKKRFASPELVVAVVFFLLAGISYFAFAEQSSEQTTKQPDQKKQVLSLKTTPTFTPTPTTVITKPPQNKTTLPSPTEPASIPSNPLTSSPSNTPQPQPTAQIQTITLQINTPDSSASHTVTYSEGRNPCTVLNDAKSEGKITSATIAYYGPPLNSDYVKELNGFQDNWTFSLNGEGKPTGCSNYKVNNGDTVTWKFN